MLCVLPGHLNLIFLSCEQSVNSVDQGNVSLETVEVGFEGTVFGLGEQY